MVENVGFGSWILLVLMLRSNGLLSGLIGKDVVLFADLVLFEKMYIRRRFNKCC